MASNKTSNERSLAHLSIIYGPLAILCLAIVGHHFGIGKQESVNFFNLLLAWVFTICCTIATDQLERHLRCTTLLGACVTTFGSISGLTCLFYIFDDLVAQPHPWANANDWCAWAVVPALFYAALIGAGTTIFMVVESIYRSSKNRQFYCLTYRGLLASQLFMGGRLIISVGTALVLGYYCYTVYIMTSQEQYTATLWPPKRIFLSCMFFWGVFWISDSWRRDKKEAIVTAIGFLLLCLLLIPVGIFSFRE